MTEPKYDEDIVNLGYLKKVISDTEENIEDTYKNVSRHYASKPNTPYYKGDTWIDGNIVYTCINSREIGLYIDSDWTTESGAKQEAESKNKTYLTQPSNYSAGDMWILQSDNDHKAGKKGEILISSAGRKEYNADDWTNMLGYGTIKSINEVSNNLNNAINRIGNVEEVIQDGIIITFYQSTIPEAKHVGDLWYVTGELEGYIKGKIYRYDGTNWVVLNDPAIQEAFDEANEARLVADGKIQSFYSDTEPTENMGVGDLWIDLANNNQLYRYNGTNWVAVYDTRINDLVTSVDSVTERVTTIETDLGEIDLKVQENTTTITTIEGNVNNITNTQAQVEGKYIHLTDSAEEPLIDIMLEGESQQATRTGKNKIPMSSFDIMGNNGTGFTYNATNHRITYSNEDNPNKGVYRYFEDFVVGTTYTLSFNIRGTAGKIARIGWNKNPRSYTLKANYERVSYQFTVPTAKEAIIFYTSSITAGGLTTDEYMEFDDVMITTDGSTDYEEYGVMPSPDYPSEIENIEGRNILDISKYADTSLWEKTTNYFMFTPVLKEDMPKFKKILSGSMKLKGTAQNLVFGLTTEKVTPAKELRILNNGNLQNANYDLKNADNIYLTIGNSNMISADKSEIGLIFNNYDIQLEEGTVATSYVPYHSLEFKVEGKNLFKANLEQGTINVTTGNNQDNSNCVRIPDFIDLKNASTITFSRNNDTTNTKARWYDANKNYIGSTPAIGSLTTVVLNVPSNAKYFRVTVDSSNLNYFTDYNVQLEVGSTATDYEPYKSQIAYFPLAEGQKLMEGSYLADNGTHHKRKQVEIDVTQIRAVTSYNNIDYASIPKPADFIGYNNYAYYEILCNKAISQKITSLDNTENINKISSQAEKTKFYLGFEKGTTLEQMKTALANTVIEYELSEEEIVPYTTAQQEAWEKIKAMYTYKNITNITSTAYAKVTYMRDNGLDVYETKQNAEKNYTETTKKLAEQKITVDGIVSEVSETKSNINTINNNLIELNETVSTTEQRVNEYEIKFEEKTKTINEELKENSETIKSMSYTFNTDELSIAKSDDPVNAKINNSGMRVYSYNELKAIFNDKGTGIQKLIVVGSAQIGNLQIVKATDENGEACTDFHHLVSNIQELTDLEVG